MAKQLTNKQKITNWIGYTIFMCFMLFGLMIVIIGAIGVLMLFAPMLEGDSIGIVKALWGFGAMFSLIITMMTLGGIMLWIMNWLLDVLPYHGSGFYPPRP